MNVARGAAVAALVVVIVGVGYLLLRSGGGHSYRLLFQNAGQLVKDDDVQVGGRRVGSVTGIDLTSDNQARISIQVSPPFAPLHEGTTATIRATSLSGIANRYIALAPGPNSAPRLPDGATLTTDQTTSIVDLDQLFDTFNPRTLTGLQQVIQGSAVQYAGRGAQGNRSTEYFAPLLSSTDRLVGETVRDQGALRDFISTSSRVVSALAARRNDLTNLVTNTNTTASAIGSENAALDQALALLPGTLRQANTTFVDLRHTLDDLDVLVAAAKPATRRLAPFLADLRPLVADARPTIHDLRGLVHQAGPNNDLTDLLLKTPRLEAASRPAFADTITAIQASLPVVQFIRPYTADLVGWLRDFGQGAANYDANGHYARVQPVFNAYSFAPTPAGGVLSPIPPSQRLAAVRSGQSRPCPGAASQPPADRSAPFLDPGATLDCNPSAIPPGP